MLLDGEEVDIFVVTAFIAMNYLNVAADEPGVLPLMLPIDAGAVGAVLLALLNGKVAPSDPLVVVFRIGARHIELLLLSDCGDSLGAKG